MSKLLLLSSLLAGCASTTHEVAHVGGNVRITDGIRGGEVTASYAINGIGVSAAEIRRDATHARTRTGKVE